MMGRPCKYQDTFPDSITDFFSVEPYREVVETITYKDGGTKDCYKEVPNDPPFLSDWCAKVKVSKVTMLKWIKEGTEHFKPEFLNAYKRAKELQKQFILVNGMRNNYSAAVAIFTLKNISGMRDERHLKADGLSVGETKIIIVRPEKDTDGLEDKANRIPREISI